MLTGSQGRRRARSVEQREQWNRYMRDYRKRNPDKARKWRDNYVLKRAARIAEERRRAGGGGDVAGD